MSVTSAIEPKRYVHQQSQPERAIAYGEPEQRQPQQQR